MKPNYKALLKNVSTFILDVDGVLSDGLVYLIGEDQVRSMSTRDGYALRLAGDRGYRICIISGGKSPSTGQRLKNLGIEDVFMGVVDKREVYDAYVAKHDLKPEEILYMGDDLPDYHVIQKAGVAVCPHDAAEEIKALVDYVSNHKGGRGCVRDVIEQTLRVQSQWFDPAKDA